MDVARCRRVDGVGWRRDFRRSRCLPCVLLSGSSSRPCLLGRGSCGLWLVAFSLSPAALPCVVPVICLSLSSGVVVGRLIVVGCRRGSCSSSVAVARRRPILLALGCRRRSCSPRRSSRRSCRCSSSRPVLLVVWRGGLAWLLFLRPPWLVRFASAGEVIRRACRSCGSSRRLPRCPHVLAWRRAACVGVSCLRLAFSRYAFRPVLRVERRGDFFFSCWLFRCSVNR